MSTQDIAHSEWLVRLRWGAILGQLGVIGFVHVYLNIGLPLVEMLGIVALTFVFNVVSLARLRRGVSLSPRTVAAMMAIDVLAFTALLYLSGGPFNPFSSLYLVYVALAAVAVGRPWTWLLTGLSFLAFGALFLDHRPLPISHADHQAAMDLHMQGMWFAFLVAAAFIVYFLGRVLRQLQAREQELTAVREQGHRAEKLASLATLAAGAAHELATPLSTIAIAAKELLRRLEREGAPVELRDDAKLVRDEVARCREILDLMAIEAGSPRGDRVDTVTVGDLVRVAASPLAAHDDLEVELGDAAALELHVPYRSVEQVVRAVIKNALEARDQGTRVSITAHADGEVLNLVVTDRGAGMTPEACARATEPFFSTKAPQGGMGMGLFLAQSVLQRLGGGVKIDSTPGRGTAVTLTLALDREAWHQPSEATFA